MPRSGGGTAIAGAIREAARKAPAGAAGPASDACVCELERLLVHEGAVGLVDFTGLAVADAKAVWPPLARWADEFVKEFLSEAPYAFRKIRDASPERAARARRPRRGRDNQAHRGGRARDPCPGRCPRIRLPATREYCLRGRERVQSGRHKKRR